MGIYWHYQTTSPQGTRAMPPPDTRRLYKTPAAHRRAQALYDAYLARISVPYTVRYVNTPYGLTHVLLAGPPEGDPVLLLHGNSLFGPHMAAQLVALAEAGYHVITPDVTGTMGRSAPTRPDRQSSAYGLWLAAVLEALDVSAAHMAGISNGAWLVLKLAEVAPERIRSACLMSAAGFVRPNWRLALALLPVMLFGPLVTPEQQSRAFLRQTTPPGFLPDALAVQAMALVLRGYRREGVPGPLPDSTLRALNAPTCLLMGQYERPFPPQAVIRRGRAVLPNLARAEVLPGVAHGMVSENPALVNQHLLGWLAAV